MNSDEKTFKIEGILVSVDSSLEDMTEAEATEYVMYAKENTNDVIKAIELHDVEGGNVEIEVITKGPKFERIRRITGNR